MSEHTKEPWCVGDTTHENGEFIETAIMALEGRAAIAVCLDFGFNNLGMREANARRIVACVNACAGIDTEKLEGVNANKYIAPRISEFLIRSRTQQRDELLAAAKNLRDVKSRYNTEIAMKRLIEAIAKVESEK